MSGVTIIWSMSAGACLALAAIHFLVWQQGRNRWGHLCFAVGAIAAAAVAACELLMMRADSVEFYGTVLYWAHLPVWVLIVSVVGFTRFYLRAGRIWLAWTVVGARTLALILNLFTTTSINFSVITALEPVTFLGETIAMAVGTPNPAGYVGKLSSLLLLIFLADASLEIWRRGERKRALYLGGSAVFFITAAAIHSVLVERSLIDSPFLVSFAYLGILASMAYESSRDVLRATQLVGELKASELQLRESEERMTLAAGAANLGIWVHDLERGEVWASDQWRALFGFAKTEQVDFDVFLQRVHPEDRDAIGDLMARPTADEESYDREYRLVLPNGGIRWIGSRGRFEFSADGTPVRRRGASLDITMRKQAELEAERHRNAAAHLSRVTTLGEISGSLAHELNQPLGAILANTEAAARGLDKAAPDVKELRAILEDVRSDVLRAADTVRSVRAFLRRRELDLQPCAVADLASEAVRLIRSDAISREVIVSVEIAPGVPPVSADRIHLQQVLLNLLVNGMDAMSTCPVEERRITIQAVCSRPREVEISVVDAGVGIAAADLPRVFDSFRTTKPDGLGLGLSICRSIVQAHGGSIALRNNADRGVTASLTLPVWGEGATPPPRYV
jgi:two-component system, LuxR family, sensor kinase FixL